jgi:choline/glycine/proline betaine transport protein
MQLPRRGDVNSYINDVVEPAMQDMALELRKQEMAVDVIQGEQIQGIRLEVALGDEMDFEYEVRARAYLRPAFNFGEIPEDEGSKYFRSEVHLREGGQNYDVMNWSCEQILADIIDQNERHLHFLHVVRE